MYDALRAMFRRDGSGGGYECVSCGAEFAVEYYTCPECGGFSVEARVYPVLCEEKRG